MEKTEQTKRTNLEGKKAQTRVEVTALKYVSCLSDTDCASGPVLIPEQAESSLSFPKILWGIYCYFFPLEID